MEHKLAPVKREHIEEAAKIIDKEGMPPSYVGEYMVEVDGKTYHFKYITRLAYKLATGKEVDPNYFQSNKNYRQKIKDLGFPVYSQNQNTMIKNPFLLSDEKLGILLKEYSNWISKNQEAQDYINGIKESVEQVKKTFLNPSYLEKTKDDEFINATKSYISKLEGPAGINLGIPRITDSVTELKNNFRYITTTQDDPFLVVDSLLDGKRKIEFFSKAFWSPILQARYPDTIPNWNNKTENLLKVLGVNVKTSKLNTAEKLRKISEAFQYLRQLNHKLDFFHLNHLMHYGYVIEEGKELIRDLLSGLDPDGSDEKQILKIYEIKAGAPATNYSRLKDNSQKAFFWNDTKFASNNTGDFIVVVSKPNNEALLTTLVSKGIPARYDARNNTTSFRHNNTEYSCEGKWDSFAYFEINQKVALDAQWRWTKAIGQSEIYDLWKPKISNIHDRIQKIDDLLWAFIDDLANESLLEFRARLIKKQVKNVLEKTFKKDSHQELIHSKEFYFTNAKNSLDELMAFDIGASKDRLKEVISQYKDEEIGFVDFVKKIQDPLVRDFFELAGKFVAHVDYNGANKNEWNSTPDKRTISKSLYTQKSWIEQIFRFKAEKSFPLSQTVQTVFNYLNNPENYLPITSENHKKQISISFLKSDYRDDMELTKKLKELFETKKFKIGNPANATRIINEALYDDELRPIWDQKHVDEEEYIKGLAVLDNTGWFEKAMEELDNNYHIVLRWDKSPTGGKKTLKLLSEAIRRDKEFFIYYISNNTAHYKATVVDFATEADFKSKKWDSIEGVARCHPNFSDYNKTREGGKISKAQILFLVNKLEKLTQPIPVEYFTFHKSFEPPTRNNMQPFVEVLQSIIVDPPPIDPKITNHEPITIINHIHQYTAGKGFRYDKRDLANFYLSLKTKPFVILAGISGTGKTKLVELFAESIGYGDPEHCVIIPVKPDWTDNSDLMGYTNLNKEFEKKKLTEVILKAFEKPDEPFFIILDEMNLARVEHYFSDFLSIIETRSLKDEKISTKPLLYESEVGERTSDRNDLINIGIPENLYIIGTVNMDETTFPFSKKVLDRANSIEMNQVELDFIGHAEEVEPIKEVYNDFLRSDKINSKHLAADDHELLAEKKFTEELKKINEILAKADLQFAYRIRDEMAFYLLNSSKINEIMSWEEAMDYQVMQKILPRIQGSAISISYLLINLINHFMGEKGKFEERTHYPDIQGDLQKYIDSEPMYSRTLRKLDFMLRRYSQDGFTSFWI